jgi:hypothetical protein
LAGKNSHGGTGFGTRSGWLGGKYSGQIRFSCQERDGIISQQVEAAEMLL